MGSNTFHLLIRGIDASGYGFDLFKKQVHVQMAEGGLANGKILSSAFKRGLACLKDFNELINELAVDDVIAFGTSVFRDAINAPEFIREAQKVVDHDIEIISGRREAELVFRGVIQAIKPSTKPYLILDIGGGSVEFILAKKKTILWCESYPLGGLRLAKNFHREDLISLREIQELKAYILRELSPMFKAVAPHKPKELIGSAGSFETFSKMEYINIRNEPFPEYSTANEIKVDHFLELAALVKKCTHAELLDIPGMDAHRAPLLPVSAILIETLIEKLGFTKMYYSDYSMKEGIFYDHFDKTK